MRDTKDVLFFFPQEGVGEGGPYEGNDISVYHVETDFVLGQLVPPGQENLARAEPSQPYIWPACLPKDDADPEFQSHDGRGMLAGWLDAPPLDQTFSQLLGGGIGEAEVLK